MEVASLSVRPDQRERVAVQAPRGEEFRTMTSNMTAAPAQLAMNPVVRSLDPVVRTMDSARSFDPVRARVRCQSTITNAERLQAQTSACDVKQRRAPLGIAMLADTRIGRYMESMHPGDIVYWVAGLGGDPVDDIARV